jgi:ankyrin repeat protein
MEKKSEIATYLINRGANVNAKDGFGMTSLMWASYNGDVELVKLLLEKGADKNIEVKGQTALSAAEEKGFTEIIELLK